MAKKDLSNQKFGKLTVIKDSGKRASNGAVIWECLCDCGNITYVTGSNLTRKNLTQRTTSCGKCYKGINLIGKKFNKLTVLEKMDYKIADSQIWKCQCDCGEISYVSSRNLQSGAVKSCGCLLSGGRKSFYNPSNLFGQKFGKLTVLEYIKPSKWKCQCDCGNIVEVDTTYLLNGKDQCCDSIECSSINKTYGSFKILEQIDKKKNGYNLYKCECQNCKTIQYKTITELKKLSSNFCKNCKIIDLTGQTFNKLTVLELDKEKTNNTKKTFWKCKCNCGNIISVAGTNLKTNNTKSCGCLLFENSSLGEQKIQNLLKNNNINFEQQKTFETCIFIKTNKKAKFDFYLSDYNLLIEYDGEQHYIETSYFNSSLKEIQEHDKIKNQWCKDNNISLIRIPYWHLKNLCIEDLLPETSKFLL